MTTQEMLDFLMSEYLQSLPDLSQANPDVLDAYLNGTPPTGGGTPPTGGGTPPTGGGTPPTGGGTPPTGGSRDMANQLAFAAATKANPALIALNAVSELATGALRGFGDQSELRGQLFADALRAATEDGMGDEWSRTHGGGILGKAGRIAAEKREYKGKNQKQWLDKAANALDRTLGKTVQQQEDIDMVRNTLPYSSRSSTDDLLRRMLINNGRGRS